MITVSVNRLTDRELKHQIEQTVLDDLLKITPTAVTSSTPARERRIVEAYYITLAETDDEILALRAAREAAYDNKTLS